ncbi:hypothetical protein LY76DRAFT_216488 [Colletotrichum caudatum]|nr:hypothetical protein LY76DRAFT_216488 [Colletotrichum caudatum]
MLGSRGGCGLPKRSRRKWSPHPPVWCFLLRHAATQRNATQRHACSFFVCFAHLKTNFIVTLASAVAFGRIFVAVTVRLSLYESHPICTITYSTRAMPCLPCLLVSLLSGSFRSGAEPSSALNHRPRGKSGDTDHARI